MKKTSIVVLCIAIASLTLIIFQVTAEEQQGQTTTGLKSATGETITNKYWGITFVAPQGWRMKKEDERYIFTSDNPDEVLLLFQHSMSTLQEFIEDYTTALSASGDKQIVPSGNYEQLGTVSLGYPVAGMFENIHVEGYMALGLNTGGARFWGIRRGFEKSVYASATANGHPCTQFGSLF